MSSNLKVDILIIGSGISGCVAALHAAEFFEKVVVLNKAEDALESNSAYAQGGIIYRNENSEKDPELLVEDIFYAGAKINKIKAAEVLANEGPGLVKKILIDALGIDFAKDKNGELDLTEEGGHRERRIIHYEDLTGRKIQEALIAAVSKHPNIDFRVNCSAVDLISSSHHTVNPLDIYEETEILGAYVFEKDQIYKIYSNVTILATGGMGSIFLHSSNPDIATGDGFAMAYRAGARLINMEYTQFHPTTLFHKDSKRFLISESVRGEGAVLLDKNGNPFMQKYHQMKDLAPRDVVTRAILTEMTENKWNHVHLDLSNVGSQAEIQKRFPHIYSTCKKHKVDISSELVPVVPAYHFSCGGIYTDLWGKTSLRRLFAVGESACTGLHGGNRLASTSLLEGLTFAYRVILYLQNNWYKFKKVKDYSIAQWQITGSEDSDKNLIYQDWSSVKNIMWNYVGPIRNKKRLTRALKDLRHLQGSLEDFYRYSYPKKEILELRNGLQTALVVAMAAWKNPNSIGAHYRES